MEPITQLREQIDTLNETFTRYLRSTRPKPFLFETKWKEWAKVVGKLEKLETKIQEETLVLQSLNKETNAKLRRYNAQLQLLRNQLFDIVESLEENL